MGKREASFDTVMESIDNNGPFQKRFNYLYNVVFALLAAMPCMNVILAMSIPDHWCHVPGREATNYSLQEWKELTLPMVVNNKGKNSTSSCDMYNFTDIPDLQVDHNFSSIKCQYGYEYDKTWYELTIPSQEDWVCDKELRVTNVFVVGRIGDMIGAFIFGQLGDLFGRRPIFFVSLAITITGKIMHLFLTKWYYWYLFGSLVAALTPMAMYQTILIIGMEISSSDDNSHIAMLQGIGWTFGVSILPMIYWWLNDWFYFVLVSSAPIVLFLIGNRYMIESPRWLASRGRLKECEKMLKQIAKVNGTTLNDDAMEILKQDSTEPEKLYGMMSLFSSWRLAKNTLMMVTCWIVGGLAHFILILNVTNMDGNPFLNFLYQGLIELPALFLGKWLTNTLGRRCTSAGAFCCAFITSLPLFYTSLDSSLHMYTSMLTVLIRFCVSVSFFVMMLQGVEIFPTCLRQTGIALGVIAGNGLGIVGPYIVYLGTTYDIRYPYLILSLMMLTGLMAQFMLPETLHHKLPETLHEAQRFGAGQKFWQLPKKPVQAFQDSLTDCKDIKL